MTIMTLKEALSAAACVSIRQHTSALTGAAKEAPQEIRTLKEALKAAAKEAHLRNMTLLLKWHLKRHLKRHFKSKALKAAAKEAE